MCLVTLALDDLMLQLHTACHLESVFKLCLAATGCKHARTVAMLFPPPGLPPTMCLGFDQYSTDRGKCPT